MEFDAFDWQNPPPRVELSAMSVVRFLTDLFESGRVIVTADAPAELEPDLDTLLVGAARTAALDLPGTPPEFSLPCAHWAARMLYRSCQFLVCRNLDEKIIRGTLRQPCPAPHSPETDYSVDLLLRFLPDLIRMTKAVSSGDPLLQELLTLAREWPLSSVGVPDLGPVSIDAFRAHPTLRQLYVDRIVACADLSRLDDPEIDSAARQALGAFPDLCPPIAKHLSGANPGPEPMAARNPDF